MTRAHVTTYRELALRKMTSDSDRKPNSSPASRESFFLSFVPRGSSGFTQTRPRWNSWPSQVRATWVVGTSFFVLGFLGLAFWSDFLASRFELTFDYSFYGQAWYLIAHGHLSPSSSVLGAPFPAWHNAAEILIWPLAVLWYLWPHPQTLLWAQDAATVACEIVLFSWCCELVASKWKDWPSSKYSLVAPVLTFLLLFTCPWVIYIDSFDFHPEAFLLLPAILAARALWRGTATLWIWLVLTLLGGALGATYVIGIGVSSLFVRFRRRVGFVLIIVGVLAIVTLFALHADEAGVGAFTHLTPNGHTAHTSVSGFDIVKNLALRPGLELSQFPPNWVDIYANLSYSGFLGILTPIGLGIPIIVTAENALGSTLFIRPLIQNNLPTLMLGSFATGIAVWQVVRSPSAAWRRFGAILAALVVANAVGWCVVWLPRIKSQFVNVPSSTATVLATIDNEIPASSEVIVSQGVAGPFAFRKWMIPVFGPGDWPVRARTVWFVVAPWNGVEVEAPSDALAEVYYAEDVLHAQLMEDRSGIFALRWHPPRGTVAVKVPSASTLPVGSLANYAGRARERVDVLGPNRVVVSNGKSGYIVAQDYWREEVGHFVASASLSCTGRVSVQVWNDTSNRLVGQEIVDTHGNRKTVEVPFTVACLAPPDVYPGFWPFRIKPLPPPPGNTFEIRIAGSSDSGARVYLVSLVPK